MSLLMARIDDRLVHGQVVVGCCEPLAARRLLVVDDVVAGDALRRDLYGAAVPPGIEVEFTTVARAPERLADFAGDGTDATTILLTRDCASMLALHVAGAALVRVTVGGLHARDGAEPVIDGFHLSRGDRSALATLLHDGVDVLFQPVPGAACVDGAQVIDVAEDRT